MWWAVLAVATAPAVGCAADGADRIASTGRAVVGGQSSEPGEYAATGALVHGLVYRCTATLIAPDVAITAAHCLAEGGFGDFAFTLDGDLSDGPDDLIALRAHHQHADFHADGPQYLTMGQRNDIGVVILEHPIEGVEPEQLDLDLDAGEIQLAGGSQLTLCGYGRDAWSVPGTVGVKRHAVVLVDSVGAWELQTTEDDPQPCRGDSGGPLFEETADGRHIVGLVSRATGDSRMCDSGAIHTRVAPYADWIAEASRDRDGGGCAVSSGGASWPPALLFALLLVARSRARRARRARAGAVALIAALAACGGDDPGPVRHGGSVVRGLHGPTGIRAVRLSGGESIRLAHGRLADFEAETAATDSASWRLITDRMVQGKSAATMRRVAGGARRTRGSLELKGEIRRGYRLPFAGVILFPGAGPMQPVDMSRHRELVLWMRGDGRRYQVVLLTQGSSPPGRQDFVAAAEWRELRLRLDDFRGADLSQVTGVMIGAGPPTGTFRLALDELEVR